MSGENFKEIKENSKGERNNKFKRISLIVALLLVTNTITALISPRIYNKFTTKVSINEIQEFKKLFATKANIDRFYDGKYEKEALLDGAIKGMTSSLKDPYTTYMDKKEYEKMSTETEGKYVGIGIQVGVTKDNKVVIISPFEDSPAHKAGILPGDIMVKVNDLKVSFDNLEKAILMMKGKKGKKINLILNREGKGDFPVELVADEIKMITVKGEVIENNLGYIRMSLFDENTADSFMTELKKLRDKEIKGLILDLRGNPGGLVDQCIKVTSNFIPEGNNIVYTMDKYNKKKEYKSMGGLAQNMPLTILVDEGTASASEILSAAVKDYKKGTIVGTKTFGKGKVQAVIDNRLLGFGDGTALKVTISHYYTPNGKNIDKKGIDPDVKVEYPKELREKPYDRNIDPQLKKAIEITKDKIK
ncbi:S41 family peptidase [Hathewaya histolytica]|uniref:S41 family peptidase n=1 Tax=Hathewaya histolytica TaxID=1498 RepID=UPI003B676BB3